LYYLFMIRPCFHVFNPNSSGHSVLTILEM
jgi:hypothetical protein